MSVDRRVFLLSAVAAPLYAGPLVTFSSEEAKLVTALTNAIIPADDTPGAAAAGVVFYIDKQLAGPLKRYRPDYERELPRLEAACREHTGRSFLELDGAAQDEWLRRLDRKGDSFLPILVDHTMQGFYGSPEHGGNRGEASWKMLAIGDVMRGHRH